MNELLIRFAAACPGHGFFSFPTWYKYLDCTEDANGAELPRVIGINNVWLIVAAVIDMLLRAAAVVAIGFVIFGGVEYITSQGQPDKTAQARSTIINGIIGLVMAVSATAVITFVAHQFN